MTGGLLTVGETMAMIAPVDAQPVEYASDFRIDAGGAESNVAVHVAALGTHARWFSKLGDDELGRRILTRLAGTGVDVHSVIIDPDRPTGLYVKSPGRGVTYYRKGSAASSLHADDAARAPLSGIRIVHVSGITAALSPTAAEFLSALIDRAHGAGVRVSFDVNHRAALWRETEAASALAALARRCDIVFVGRDEAEGLWGTPTADEIHREFAGVPELVVKDGDIGATVFRGGVSHFEPAESVDVVEAVGAGDAFAGGYLAALLAGGDPLSRLRAGHIRAALTLRTTADFVDGRPA